MGITIQQATRELVEIEAKLQDLEKLHKRRELLRQFVALGEQLTSPNGTSPAATAMTVEARNVPRPPVTDSQDQEQGPSTAVVAYKLLQGYSGKMHIQALVEKAKEAGWVGSGDDARDKSRFYIAMHRQPKKFKRYGGGYWSVREQSGIEKVATAKPKSEVLADFIRMNGPQTRNFLLEHAGLKPGTLAACLNDKSKFKRLEDGRWDNVK
jgi:hypothetical protein